MLTQFKLTTALKSNGITKIKMNMDLSTLRKKLHVFYHPHYKVTEEQWLIKKIGQLLNKLCPYGL